MELKANAGPKTNSNILRKSGIIPDTWIGSTQIWAAEVRLILGVVVV